MVNQTEFTLKLFGLPPTLHANTNYDTTKLGALDSQIRYSDPSRHQRARIINEFCKSADQKRLNFVRRRLPSPFPLRLATSE